MAERLQKSRYSPEVGGEFDERDMFASAAVIQNMYNGIENIFKQITKYYGIPLPTTPEWHITLMQWFSAPPTTSTETGTATGTLCVRAFLFEARLPKVCTVVSCLRECPEFRVSDPSPCPLPRAARVPEHIDFLCFGSFSPRRAWEKAGDEGTFTHKSLHAHVRCHFI
jgi:hypothetical protein